MAWCPKCMTEYREGYTNCSDCGEPLLPYEAAKELHKELLKKEQEELFEAQEGALGDDPDKEFIENEEAAQTDALSGKAAAFGDGKTFTSSADRYQENRSAGYMFIIIGICVIIGLLCAIFGGMSFFKGNYLTISVMTLLGVACILIGIFSLRHAKQLKLQIDAELESTTAIQEWLAENITKEQLSELGMDKEPEELRYFDRIAYMKDRLVAEFPSINDAYCDQVCEDHYNRIME